MIIILNSLKNHRVCCARMVGDRTVPLSSHGERVVILFGMRLSLTLAPSTSNRSDSRCSCRNRRRQKDQEISRSSQDGITTTRLRTFRLYDTSSTDISSTDISSTMTFLAQIEAGVMKRKLCQ